MKNRNRLILSTVLALSALVAAAAIAWACVPTPSITVNPKSGPAGTTVTVNGTGFYDTGPVTIRWNDTEPIRTLDPPTDGNHTSGYAFQVQVQVPSTAAPGCHTITAHQPGQRLPGAAAFEIPGSGCNDPPPPPRPPGPTTPPPGGGAATGGFFPTASDVNCQGKGVTTVGTSGRDVIEGTGGADVIAGLGGDDTIKGLGGNDVICGGAGKDKLAGGAGSDRLSGGAGRDLLNGGPGADRMNGGAAKDKCVGGPGRDRAKSC